MLLSVSKMAVCHVISPRGVSFSALLAGFDHLAGFAQG